MEKTTTGITVPMEQGMQQVRFCPHCGATVQRVNARFCETCHQSLYVTPTLSLAGALPQGFVLKQRYQLEGKLGEGGFAAVYKARDLVLSNAWRAIKEMCSQGQGTDTREIRLAADAFKQEATLLAGLMHPNLPRIYDHFEEQGHWFLVMDYIEGETLEKYLSRMPDRKLPPETVLPLAIQLSTVLGYLHSQQPPIIFRDVKPANIMLTADGHLYLIDFGIARLFKTDQARDTIALGSPGYAAPEQYGKAQTGPQADIYGLGATLHHLLSGRDPSEEPFRFPPLHLSSRWRGLEYLIVWMVSVRQEDRPASMQEVRQECERLMMQAGMRAGPLPAYAPLSVARPRVVVAKDGSGDFQSIQEALASVSAGTRICIRPGIYQEALVLNKEVELVGEGIAEQVILSNQYTSCIRMRTSRATVKNLTIRGEASEAAIEVGQGVLHLEYCDLSATVYTALEVEGQDARVVLRRCKVHNGGWKGVVLYNYARGRLEDCDIYQNEQAGLSIWMHAGLELKNCRVHECAGNGIEISEQSFCMIENCEFFQNDLLDVIAELDGKVEIKGSRLHASASGIVIRDQGEGVIENCEVYGHALDEIRVCWGGKLTARESRFYEGKQCGLRVHAGGSASLSACRIYANQHKGIDVAFESSAEIKNCWLYDGGNDGICIREGGTATIEACYFRGNALQPIREEEGSHVYKEAITLE